MHLPARTPFAAFPGDGAGVAIEAQVFGPRPGAPAFGDAQDFIKAQVFGRRPGAPQPIREVDLLLSDLTDLNASTARHGFQKKLSGNASEYQDGTGAWSTPAGTPGGIGSTKLALLAFLRAEMFGSV